MAFIVRYLHDMKRRLYTVLVCDVTTQMLCHCIVTWHHNRSAYR